MGFQYAVIGSGRQGIAAAYDMVKFGNADSVMLVDIDDDAAIRGAEWVNSLLGGSNVEGIQMDVRDRKALNEVLRDTTSLLSAVPYTFNHPLTELAITTGTNMCDLGGHTGIVRQQLEMNTHARDAGVSIVPDCGMGPGMNVSLATYVMSLLDAPREVLIWDGGLPQDPKPPWNYALTFNINGLTNEYYGNAFFLRDGKIAEVPCFSGYEQLSFPEPIGTLEAFVTSGGLSTAPWTFQGILQRLENKTLRYPGHCEQFKAYSELGLFGEEPIEIGEGEDKTVVPRDIYHALLEPKIHTPDVKDIAVMRVMGVGMKDGQEATVTTELIDRYDKGTGFTAMQRLTGWHASIMTILTAQDRIRKGAVSVELAVPGNVIMEEARKRGFDIVTTVTPVD